MRGHDGDIGGEGGPIGGFAGVRLRVEDAKWMSSQRVRDCVSPGFRPVAGGLGMPCWVMRVPVTQDQGVFFGVAKY